MSDRDHSLSEIIVVDGAVTIPSLFGPQDAFRRYLERRLDVKVNGRGDKVTISGSEASRKLTERAIDGMLGRIRGGATLFLHDIDQLVTVLEADGTIDLAALETEVHSSKEVSGQVRAKTPNQKKYLEAIATHDLVFVTGPAGTGKTYLAMAAAVTSLLGREVERIILARPAVEAGERLGFLPGSLVDKVNPYLRPLHDALFDLLGVEQAGRLMDNGTIEVAPLAFMRGRTLNRSFVILDEAQNTTREQMKMFLTRLGHGSSAIVTGDLTQTDLDKGKESGLKHASRILRKVEGIAHVELKTIDVVRHGLVRSIIKAYDSAEKRRKTS